MTNSQYPVIVTGATGAIGHEICRALAEKGFGIVVACRNVDKGNALAAELRADFPDIDVCTLLLDLSSAEATAAAASSLAGRTFAGLINNAGVMNRHFTLNADGVESTIAVNYLNTKAFTELVMPLVEPGGTIVFTTSITRKMHPSTEWPLEVTEKTFSQLGTYGRSKTLITKFAASLAASSSDLRINCADPGIVDSNMITMHRWYDRLADIIFRPFIRSPRSGAVPAVRAFLSENSGKIFGKHFSFDL